MLLDEDLPNLNEIERERWSEVLRPLSHRDRDRAVSGLHSMEGAVAARMLLGQLLLEDPPPEEMPPPSLPEAPEATRPPRARQLSIRISGEQHERLARVGRTVGLSPTAMARVFVLRGVDAALRGREA